MNAQSTTAVRGPFLGKAYAGLFEAVEVELSTQKRPTAIVGAFAVGCRVRMKVKAVLPPIEGLGEVVITGQRGEGAGSGALGLDDWLPTAPGGLVTLAFNPDSMSKSKDYVYLAQGGGASAAWRDCERFYAGVTREGTLEPNRVTAAITTQPRPQTTFFRLMVAYDRSPLNDPGVVHALAIYYADPTLEPLLRRNQVAHYMSAPATTDTDALSALATGLFQLILDLAASGQAASSGVVFQRMAGYLQAPGGAFRVPPPANARQHLGQLRELVTSEPAGVPAAVQNSIISWLAGNH
jgi:hypothetical protein